MLLKDYAYTMEPRDWDYFWQIMQEQGKLSSQNVGYNRFGAEKTGWDSLVLYMIMGYLGELIVSRLTGWTWHLAHGDSRFDVGPTQVRTQIHHPRWDTSVSIRPATWLEAYELRDHPLYETDGVPWLPKDVPPNLLAPLVSSGRTDSENDPYICVEASDASLTYFTVKGWDWGWSIKSTPSRIWGGGGRSPIYYKSYRFLQDFSLLVKLLDETKSVPAVP